MSKLKLISLLLTGVFTISGTALGADYKKNPFHYILLEFKKY